MYMYILRTIIMVTKVQAVLTGRSTIWELIVFGLSLYHPSASVSSVYMATFFSLPFSELSLVGLALDLVD